MTTLIRVRYQSLDRYSESRTFKTLAGARKYAQKWVGPTPEIGRFYAVSGDGMGKIMASVDLADLFPAAEQDCGCMKEVDEQGILRVVTHSSVCPEYLGY